MPLISDQLIEQITEDIESFEPELVLESFTDDDKKIILKALIQERHSDVLDTEGKVDFVVSRMVGLGFIDDIMQSYPNVTDIRYNGTDVVLKTNEDKFKYTEQHVSEDDVIKLINRFAIASKQEFTEKNTELDAQMGYMRINGVHKKNALYGATMAIRISKPRLVLTEDNFSDFADDFMYYFFKCMMQAGSNIILCGKTGAGKTEFQKLLVSMLDFNVCIVVIEDTPEGHFKVLFPELDIVSWYTGRNLSYGNLIKDALRNDADWIIVTETRDKEAYDMFQAVLSGHNIVTTVHAKSAKEIPNRYLNMMKMGYRVDDQSFLDDFFHHFNLGCHLTITDKLKGKEGKTVRYLDEVVEYLEDGRKQIIYERWEDNGEFKSKVHPISNNLVRQLSKQHIDIEPLREVNLVETQEKVKS